ncbi:class I SAM-dependent methyltransferase [Billgrantia azerbaijanica]|nr:class I SAM-dependent methyltransferase [Halomonas azerbaijanica]
MNAREYNKNAYDEMASRYQEKRNDPERSGWNNCLEVPAMESILKPISQGKLTLDLGCGTGILTEKLMAWKALPVGVDHSTEMIKLARQNIPQIEFRIGSAEALPYPNDHFDLVASSLMMHYIKDLLPVFGEVSRVLKPDADFVFSMHHPFHESFKIEKERSHGKPVLQPYFHNDEYHWEMCGTRLISFHHTFESIVKALTACGFVLKDLIECKPAEDTREHFEAYEFASKYPSFCVFHAVKTEGASPLRS